MVETGVGSGIAKATFDELAWHREGEASAEPRFPCGGRVVSGRADAELAEKTALSTDEVTGAIKTLENHDVIEERNGQYSYTVELMVALSLMPSLNKLYS